jgi:uroporphyrinogen-III synthase
VTPQLVPPQAVAESLAGALLPHARQPNGTATRFLLVRAEEAREHLPETLRGAGGEVTVAPAYGTVIPAASVELIRDLFPPAADSRVTHEIATSSRMGGARSPDLPQPSIDAITFTSSSTARNLVALCNAAEVTLPESALRVSIGPITSQTLRDLGLPPHAEAPEATVTSLAETLMTVLRKRQP